MLTKPRWTDCFILSVLTILITLQPYYLHGDLNLFELSLYLPGIDAILDGKIPFRDFFHLRGPFELYFPALLMKIFGEDIAILSSYFYFGTVLTMIFAICIARELYRTRLFLYLMVPVFIARTFPRVVFSYWGGMRFGFGLLAIFFILRFFNTKKWFWIFAAGIVTALGLFTSIEIGICVLLGFCAAQLLSLILRIHERRFLIHSSLLFLGGFFSIVIPYLLYLHLNQALIPYFDSVYSVVQNMQNVIDPHLISIYPRNFSEALAAMLNPGSINFKHMTPSYLYLFLLGFLIWKLRKREFHMIHMLLVCLGVFGFVMYNTAFRGIWASQFEMALQPEKILLFFLLESFFLFLLLKKGELQQNLRAPSEESARTTGLKTKIVLINILFILLIFGGTLGYSFQRFNHRFISFKLVKNLMTGKSPELLRPMPHESSRTLMVERAARMTVSNDQADEIESIVEFVQESTDEEDSVLMFPEWGIYNFLFDRPFPGRFPVVTFSWFNNRWHHEFVENLKKFPPKLILVPKKLADDWKKVHISSQANISKYQDVLDFIHSHYVLKTSTPNSLVYQFKSTSSHVRE